MSKRRLPQAKEPDEPAPTVMDRALAAAHGAPYVHLVAFAIDIDRVYSSTGESMRPPRVGGGNSQAAVAPTHREGRFAPGSAASDDAELPLGWEVFLTECYAVAKLDPEDAAQRLLLEETCLSLLEQPPDAQGYGSQLLFAVYDATERGLYPKALRGLFRSWRARPRQLQRALDSLWRDPATALRELADHCLESGVDVSAPTRRALQIMSEGQWPLAR